MGFCRRFEAHKSGTCEGKAATVRVKLTQGMVRYGEKVAEINMRTPTTVLAYGCRYRWPHKRLINRIPLHSLTLSRLRRRVFLRSPPIFPAVSAVLSCSSNIIPRRYFTGNSLCSGMERFWSSSSVNKNKAMVEHLEKYGVITSKKVAEVMSAIDRSLFVPDLNAAYVDSPMPIGYNATISAPHMHATCLQLLEDNLQPGMHALDVGSGTGYLTACFALMVGAQGRAAGVEHIPELVTSSIQNIQKSAAATMLEKGSLSVHIGDGRLGWPDFAPYDAIHVGAAAPQMPQELINQLKPGGRMVIPVGNIFQDLKVVDKNLDGSVTVRSETSVRYVPLTSREAQLQQN